jgi:hypothetical protein
MITTIRNQDQHEIDPIWTHHQVLLAALRAVIDFDIDSLGNPIARAVRTAMPLYI